MKFLIMNIVFLMSIASYAGDDKVVRKPIYRGSDQGGGGHVIVDANGNLIPLDQYEGTALGKYFKLEDVCPNGLKEIEISNSPQYAKAYSSVLEKLSVLREDKAYRLAEINLHQSLSRMKWYACDQDLPLIADHRFRDGVLTKELLQIAMQTPKGEVVFASPVLNRLLKQSNGQAALEATIVHEIVLRTWGSGITRDKLSTLVRGFIERNERYLLKLYNQKDYLVLFLTAQVNERAETPIAYKIDIHLESGEVFSLKKNKESIAWDDDLDFGIDKKYVVVKNKKVLTKGVNYTHEMIGDRWDINRRDRYSFKDKIVKICMSDMLFDVNRSLFQSYLYRDRNYLFKTVDFTAGLYNAGEEYAKLPSFFELKKIPYSKTKSLIRTTEPACVDLGFID